MFVEERQNLILEDLQENGKVLVKDLSTRFGVTPDLIRKDLAFLESKGKCKKIYGGAILNRLNVHLEDANSRKSVNSKEKQKIAQMAYDLIEPNMTVFLDISTTNIELAKLLVTYFRYYSRYEYVGCNSDSFYKSNSFYFYWWRI